MSGHRTILLAGACAVVVAASVTAAVFAATGLAKTTAGGPAAVVLPPISTAGFPTGPGQPGIFTDRCGFSHEAADDPILAVNDTGAAMHHDFFGNSTTSASSTAATLVGKATTCSTGADASAYWTPVLYQNGRALVPNAALIYWRRPARDAAAVQTFPAGMQLIAGNETATAPQSLDVVAWTCTGAGAQRRTTQPHDCAEGSFVRVIVTFPSCWDGHSLGGRGQTNVVYRTAAGCPASHPVQVPEVVFHVSWPTSSAAALTLSLTPTVQGSTDTMHVDVINGWTQNVLNRDVAACIATSTRCGPVTGADAVPHGPGMVTRQRHR
ncbi:MAG TPA: DUF1996 domain-containing protein [Jatrophihabitantaceae bacterium]|jgi:hypothetical protein|nr:DUF1996 domain-containing protein [Jatrophihabitantaceae bacterium]